MQFNSHLEAKVGYICFLLAMISAIWIRKSSYSLTTRHIQNPHEFFSKKCYTSDVTI